jgi:hypothetical protein
MTDNQQPSVERACRKCGASKPLEDFAIVYAKNKRGQNYRQHTCASCARDVHAERMRKARARSPKRYRKHQREHYKRNHSRVREQAQASRRRAKLRVLEAYGGAVCVCCSETSLSMLTIDHVNNDGRKHREEIGKLYKYDTGKQALVAEMYTWLEKNGFPSGFQVLCYNCNMSKHRNKGVCEHKLNEGSTTRAEARSLEAIAKRSSGRRYSR